MHLHLVDNSHNTNSLGGGGRGTIWKSERGWGDKGRGGGGVAGLGWGWGGRSDL